MGLEIVRMIDNAAAVQEALERQTQAALEAIGLQAEGYAKTECPVDTGRLRNSISHAVEGDSAYIGTNVEYAPYVEMGTSRMAAQPYLRPAAHNHGPEYKQIAEHYLKNG